jgi:hypothetical protein
LFLSKKLLYCLSQLSLFLNSLVSLCLTLSDTASHHLPPLSVDHRYVLSLSLSLSHSLSCTLHHSHSLSLSLSVCLSVSLSISLSRKPAITRKKKEKDASADQIHKSGNSDFGLFIVIIEICYNV